MDLMVIGLAVVGLVLLVGGAEVLIKGASRLASSVGVSPLVVGLTVVAFGTSAPELAVSLASAARGQADIALGNVVGSNIFNVLFILGLSALVAPLLVAQKLLRVEVPLMIASAAAVWLLGQDGRIGRLDGALLAAGIVAYTVFAIVQSRKETRAVQAEYAKEFGEDKVTEKPAGFGATRLGQVLFILVGLAMLVAGSHWLVDGAVAVARYFGLSELVIGLTIVAAGTSLPEVATSVTASLRGERDIAVGNVVGSNIFNVLAVLGLTSALSPGGVGASPAALGFDVPIMVAVSVACLPIFFTGGVISRWEGALFIGYYVAYVGFLVLAATSSALRPALGSAMLYFALPLTFVTLAVVALGEARRRGLRKGTPG
jgi:cation:H+ antiporter